MASTSLSHIPRLWRTLRHLPPSQIAWRMRYLIQRRLEAQVWFQLSDRIARRIDVLPAELWRPHFLAAPVPPPPEIDRLAELRQGRLTLFNQQRPFSGGNDWRRADDPQKNRLWNFGLHYHAWLRDLAAGFIHSRNPECLDELRRRLVDWLDTCPPGAPGFADNPWNSYNIGQRLTQWREIDALVPHSFWNHPELTRQRFLHSIALQAEYLAHHIEWDLRGNHLFKDAVGLAVAAEMLHGPAASRWRSQAIELAISQADEQILPDGLHFERSPMYHEHVLDDLRLLTSLIPEDREQVRLAAACQRMADASPWLRHPCGRLVQFNDGWQAGPWANRIGDGGLSSEIPSANSPTHDEARTDGDLLPPPRHSKPLSTHAARPPCRGLHHFTDAGLVAWHGDPWTIFFDVGEIGPDVQPGHAHADTLTLEASFADTLLIVDPGTYCYDPDSHRQYDRSTRAHNTVCIDDADSSEVWQIFRVGRRARPLAVSVSGRDDGFQASASHSGYDHLAGQPRHRRHIELSSDGELAIHDEVTGQGLHRVEGGFLLSPEWTVELHHSGWWLRNGPLRLTVHLHPNQTVEFDVVTRPWHPDFGREIPTRRLVWSGNVTLPFRVTTLWEG